MSTLNILCPICNEFYQSEDIVYATSACGHLFHQQCLSRWLARSATCPQCRQNCHRNRVHRVYLNFCEPPPVDEEAELGCRANILNWIPLGELTHPGQSAELPAGAIKAGVDPEGNDSYVARAYLHEDLLPANYIPHKGGAYTPWNCRAHFVRDEVEVLVDCDHQWVAATNGHVPENAIVTGYAESGEDLYTGRSQYEGITLCGKVHPSHRVLYMPYNGQEVNVKEYEVLVHIPKEPQPQQPTQQ